MYLSVPVVVRHIIVVRNHDVWPDHGPGLCHVVIHVGLVHHAGEVRVLSQHTVKLVYLMGQLLFQLHHRV